jgi:hypothetical protein
MGFPFSFGQMLSVAAPYRLLFQNLGLRSVEAISRFFLGAASSPKSKVVIQRATVPASGDLAPLDVFFKQYQYRQPAWSFIGRRSKARREFENYAVFSRLQLSTAEAVAVGEERDIFGRLRRAFIVTRAIPEAQTLIEFINGPARDRSRADVRNLRRQLIEQLAEMTRRIHDAGFFHRDLFWRNVLVTTGPGKDARLWWIDCPRGGFARWWTHRRGPIKDLACLDKSAGRWCTRGERVLFVKKYLGLARLDPAAKQRIRNILHYRKHRWPGDCDGG